MFNKHSKQKSQHQPQHPTEEGGNKVLLIVVLVLVIILVYSIIHHQNTTNQKVSDYPSQMTITDTTQARFNNALFVQVIWSANFRLQTNKIWPYSACVMPPELEYKPSDLACKLKFNITHIIHNTLLLFDHQSIDSTFKQLVVDQIKNGQYKIVSDTTTNPYTYYIQKSVVNETVRIPNIFEEGCILQDMSMKMEFAISTGDRQKLITIIDFP